MEQTHSYARLIILDDQEKAALMAAPIQVTLNQVAFKLFNAKAFEVKDNMATGFHASNIEKEFVTFIEPVSLDGAHTQVLESLEKAMNESVRRDVNICCDKRSLEISEQTGCAQAVLVADDIYYTSIIEKDLHEENMKCKDLIKAEVDCLIKQAKQDLSAANRTLLTSRITIGLVWLRHAEKLADPSILPDHKDIIWKSVLKFYMHQMTVLAKIDDCSMIYGYQYQGNINLLAVTDLTEIVYKNATNAVFNNKPHASTGPAGTGKTETIKDLAHKLGRFCVTVNMSDQYTKKQLQSLIQVGCLDNTWLIFDEFTRLIPAMIDVVDEYLSLIYEAKIKKMSEVKHEGDNLVIKLEPTHNLGIFVTFNPNYLGRAELPESLKIKLAETKMTAPDFAALALVMLGSSGFLECKVLGEVMKEVLVACKNNLSKTPWYDWGLRKMSWIVKVAKALLVENDSKSEHTCICNAFKIVCDAKLKEEDCEPFNAILTANGLAPQNFEKVLNTKANIPEQYQHKAYLFEQLLKYRHCSYVMGLDTNFTRLVAESNGWHVEVLENYGQLQNDQMYGTSDNRNGILPTMLKRCIHGDLSKKEGLKLIVLQGEVNADWMESMASVMDDNKRLSLPWGEHIHLTPDIRIVFETYSRTCRNLTPASISRGGVLLLTEAWTETSQEEIDAKGLVKDVYGNYRLPTK